MILINIRRGLCNKRFWIVVGVTTIIYAVIIVLECWFPVQKYYRGYNTPDWYLDGLAALGSSKVNKILQLELFHNLFPFVGALAFAYVILDDRRHTYYYQIIQKKGLSNYFWSDFLTSGLMGGILAVILLLALIFVAKTGIDYNPFIKDAVHAYQEMFKDAICGKVYWGDKMIGECNNYLIWWSLGCIGFFLAGFWFGLISALVAFLSDNKVFVYAMPIIVTMIIDKWAYIFTIIFKNNETICNLLFYPDTTELFIVWRPQSSGRACAFLHFNTGHRIWHAEKDNVALFGRGGGIGMKNMIYTTVRKPSFMVKMALITVLFIAALIEQVSNTGLYANSFGTQEHMTVILLLIHTFSYSDFYIFHWFYFPYSGYCKRRIYRAVKYHEIFFKKYSREACNRKNNFFLHFVSGLVCGNYNVYRGNRNTGFFIDMAEIYGNPTESNCITGRSGIGIY